MTSSPVTDDLALKKFSRPEGWWGGRNLEVTGESARMTLWSDDGLSSSDFHLRLEHRFSGINFGRPVAFYGSGYPPTSWFSLHLSPTSDRFQSVRVSGWDGLIGIPDVRLEGGTGALTVKSNPHPVMPYGDQRIETKGVLYDGASFQLDWTIVTADSLQDVAGKVVVEVPVSVGSVTHDSFGNTYTTCWSDWGTLQAEIPYLRRRPVPRVSVARVDELALTTAEATRAWLAVKGDSLTAASAREGITVESVKVGLRSQDPIGAEVVDLGPMVDVALPLDGALVEQAVVAKSPGTVAPGLCATTMLRLAGAREPVFVESCRPGDATFTVREPAAPQIEAHLARERLTPGDTARLRLAVTNCEVDVDLLDVLIRLDTHSLEPFVELIGEPVRRIATLRPSTTVDRYYELHVRTGVDPGEGGARVVPMLTMTTKEQDAEIIISCPAIEIFERASAAPIVDILPRRHRMYRRETVDVEVAVTNRAPEVMDRLRITLDPRSIAGVLHPAGRTEVIHPDAVQPGDVVRFIFPLVALDTGSVIPRFDVECTYGNVEVRSTYPELEEVERTELADEALTTETGRDTS